MALATKAPRLAPILVLPAGIWFLCLDCIGLAFQEKLLMKISAEGLRIFL